MVLQNIQDEASSATHACSTSSTSEEKLVVISSSGVVGTCSFVEAFESRGFTRDLVTTMAFVDNSAVVVGNDGVNRVADTCSHNCDFVDLHVDNFAWRACYV